jgi:hypothetical protein
LDLFPVFSDGRKRFFLDGDGWEGEVFIVNVDSSELCSAVIAVLEG